MLPVIFVTYGNAIYLILKVQSVFSTNNSATSKSAILKNTKTNQNFNKSEGNN